MEENTNPTIQALKDKALSELKAEQTTEQTTETKVITEITAQVVNFDKIEAILTAKNKAVNDAKIVSLFGQISNTTDVAKQLELHEQINKTILEAKSQVLADFNSLPRYAFLVDTEGNEYLIPVQTIAKTVKQQAGNTTEKNAYPYPYKIGDMVYLLGKDKAGNDVKSQVYKVTPDNGMLLGQDDKIAIRASKAVENFERLIGNERVNQENFKGFAGLTYPKWRELQK